ncbi:NAD-dependent epimerase/dehydratase family protein [Candidatus Dependentiae bacterium]|nr:MAG: NAD-dependent epimerase/dehydratase family protein [Candidatus Dependentiae bacterium]
MLSRKIMERNRAMKQFYHGRKVLVTGGCGFIGSHLAEHLVALGSEVTVLDDLSGGFIENIEKIKDKITFIQDTVTCKKACLDASRNKDIIFHLAAFISVPESVEKPEMCHKINVDGTVNLLEAARVNDVERFVLSSSGSVYGPYEIECHEELQCYPQSPYAFSKYIGELYCRQYAINYGLKTISLRYFNVYGPRQNPKSAYAAAYATFVQQMQQNKPIIVYGDGKQTRDFVSVFRVVEANLILAMQDANKLKGQVFNIATGKSITILKLIDQIREKHPEYNQDINFAPARAGDLKHSCAACSKYLKIYNECYKELHNRSIV